jgi:hypothetical protein
VYLAARGLRDLDGGAEKIDDPGELAQVRRQAKLAHIEAVVGGIVLTGLAIAVV